MEKLGCVCLTGMIDLGVNDPDMAMLAFYLVPNTLNQIAKHRMIVVVVFRNGTCICCEIQATLVLRCDRADCQTC